jgi:hypothetical protein
VSVRGPPAAPVTVTVCSSSTFDSSRLSAACTAAAVNPAADAAIAAVTSPSMASVIVPPVDVRVRVCTSVVSLTYGMYRPVAVTLASATRTG